MGILYNYRAVEKKWEEHWASCPEDIPPDSSYPFPAGRRGREAWPFDLVADYGLDALYLCELFKSDTHRKADWDEGALEGIFRYLGRVWRMAQGVDPGRTVSGGVVPAASGPAFLSRLQEEIAAADQRERYHTVVARLMQAAKEWKTVAWRDEEEKRAAVQTYAKILLPYAPHLASEILTRGGAKT